MGSKREADARIDGDAIVKCEGCGDLGRRRPGHPCPDHWLYLESVDRTPGQKKNIVHIVWACSEECSVGMWKRGPGPNVIDEDRRTIRG